MSNSVIVRFPHVVQDIIGYYLHKEYMKNLKGEIKKSGLVVENSTVILRIGGKRKSFREYHQKHQEDDLSVNLCLYEKSDKKGNLHGWVYDYFEDGNIESKSYWMNGRRCVLEDYSKNGSVTKFEVGDTDEEFENMVGDLEEFRKNQYLM